LRNKAEALSNNYAATALDVPKRPTISWWIPEALTRPLTIGMPMRIGIARLYAVPSLTHDARRVAQQRANTFCRRQRGGEEQSDSESSGNLAPEHPPNADYPLMVVLFFAYLIAVRSDQTAAA
jgi:hypothetical protein